MACYICGKTLTKNFAKDNNHRKVSYHCYFEGRCRGAAYSVCNLRFNSLSKIPVVSHNDSNYDYQSILNISKRVLWTS